MIILSLILVGLCFGSFTNALVWRVYQQSLDVSKRKASSEELSLSKGRSMCVHCGHTLNALDLIPLFSWLFLKRKCRYCHKEISWQYPLVEFTTMVLFVVSYIFWPYELVGYGIAAFGAWLVLLVGFMALLVYDVRWMLLPNRIVFPLYGVTTGYIVTLLAVDPSLGFILNVLGGIAVGGGVFYALFQISKGQWIGGGDVKLGFMLGALTLTPLNAGLMLFISSLFGTVFAFVQYASKGAISQRIPFGPFLIAATIVVVLFGNQVIDWYMLKFLGV